MFICNCIYPGYFDKKEKKYNLGKMFVRYALMSTAHLRIDKGSRCMLRYTYAFLITLMAFLLS